MAIPEKTELDRLRSLLDGGCNCFSSPPCWWCTSMEEDEGEAYWNGGQDALNKILWAKLEALE